MLKNRCCLFILIWFGLSACGEVSNSSSKFIIDSLYVDHVWSGHPVGFDMITDPPHQFIAYYDSNRVMTIAQRKLEEQHWIKKQLDEQVGWDSHNSIEMVLDSKGYLHVSGNMHVDTLVYFQSKKPYDIETLERRDSLIGKDEYGVTYPEFMQTPNGNLIFTYRIGSSGKGNQIFNKYDPETGQWSRLLDEPLLNGRGEMNAYMHGPIAGPDDFFHLIWVWRDNPGAETNHDLSYAKSKDLVNWFQSDGSIQETPITIGNGEIIDPVPVKGGLLNGNTVIGFDHQDRVVVSYHKYDENGFIQIYNARLEGGKWEIHKTTNWNFRWEFGGWGSIGSRVGMRSMKVEDGSLVQSIYIDTVGIKKHVLNKKDLSTKQTLPVKQIYPLRLDVSKEPYSVVHFRRNIEAEHLYLLRWETLGRNRDRPREGVIPPASQLILYKIKRNDHLKN